MTEQERKDWDALEEAAEEAGGYVDPHLSDIHYDMRAILKFCKEKGIEPIDMTIRELNQFIIKG